MSVWPRTGVFARAFLGPGEAARRMFNSLLA
jgi:hypothetical protein